MNQRTQAAYDTYRRIRDQADAELRRARAEAREGRTLVEARPAVRAAEVKHIRVTDAAWAAYKQVLKEDESSKEIGMPVTKNGRKYEFSDNARDLRERSALYPKSKRSFTRWYNGSGRNSPIERSVLVRAGGVRRQCDVAIVAKSNGRVVWHATVGMKSVGSEQLGDTASKRSAQAAALKACKRLAKM